MVRRLFACASVVALLATALASHVGGTRAFASPLFSNVNSAAKNIHLAMLFNNNETNKSVETGKIDYVWGADQGWNMTNSAASGVHHDWYTFFTRDTQDNSNHDLAWFQANHPDWIEYKCDRTTALHGNGWVEYDITNPTLRAYALTYVQQAMAGGYNGVDFDVTDTFNYDHACGHFDQHGAWVQQYNGATSDSAYQQAVIAAFQTFTQQIRTAASSRGISFTIAINPTFNTWKPLAQTEDLFPYVDVVLDEDGFTRGGYSATNRLTASSTDYSSSEWQTKMQWYGDLLSLGKGLLINGEEPYNVTGSSPPASSDVNWVLANYLLIKNSFTYQGLITGYGQYGGPYYPLAAYNAQIGTPTDTMRQSQNVWMRDFTGGVAMVNPSPDSAFTVSLPAGNYVDLQGNPVGPTVSLPAGGSGMVVLGSPSTPTAVSTVSPTNTSVPTATSTPIATTMPTPISTVAPTNTAQSTSTPSPTSTPQPQATNSPTPTTTPSATSTTQPTNTPAPTSTPRPTATPSPPTSTPTTPSNIFGQVLVNGGFEGGSQPWTGGPTSSQQMINTAQPHTGSFSAGLCGYAVCTAHIQQSLTVSPGFSHATLEYWILVTGRGATFCMDSLSAQVWSQSGSPIASYSSHCNPQSGGQWTHQTVDLTTTLRPYAGQSIQLLFRASTNWASADHLYLDDITLTLT